MIRTKYLGPTDTRGARIRATDGQWRITMPYPHELNVEDAHAAAAAKLVDLIHGQNDERIEYAVARSTQDDGYCFYRVERD